MMTVREALRIIVRDESLGDWVYDVRERVGCMDDGHTGTTWDHPRVKAFSDAVVVLRKELERLEADA